MTMPTQEELQAIMSPEKARRLIRAIDIEALARFSSVCKLNCVYAKTKPLIVRRFGQQSTPNPSPSDSSSATDWHSSGSDASST